MTGPVHQRLDPGLRDRIDPAPVLDSRTEFAGRVWDVRTDTVDLGTAGRVSRDYVQHTGAVAVVALRGDPGAEEILLIQQYRHPVGVYDWEVPAGLLDKPGEDPRDAAARELREEVDLDARHWNVLLDVFTSPGALSENLRIFLARDVFPCAADGFEREDEEVGMPTGWLSLDDALVAVATGRLHNAIAVCGILTADAARRSGWAGLRPADAPWPEHPAYR